MEKHRQTGFTLIELSIVLVIIGLIVGGVLVGRDLIHSAQVRATVSQFEKFSAAANTFRTKYNCLPGDCANASQFGMAADSNGNGDGSIGPCPNMKDFGCNGYGANQYQIMGEKGNFWYHLSFANLIPYKFNDTSGALFVTPGIYTPSTKISTLATSTTSTTGLVGGFLAASAGDVYVQSTNSVLSNPGNGFFIGAGDFFGVAGTFAPGDMQAIDQKIDDGLPLSGSVTAFDGSQFGYPFLSLYSVGTGGPTAAVCVRNDTTPYKYNASFPGSNIMYNGNCGVFVRGNF